MNNKKEANSISWFK